MSKDFDGRFGHVLVVVRGASLAEVLELPGLVLAGLDVGLELYSGQPAEFPETSIRTRPPAQEDGSIGLKVLRHEALNVRVDDTVHRSVERLPGLHSAVVEPTP